MPVRSRYIRGALAYWDTHRKRLVDAVGQNVVKYVNDFVFTPGPDASWDDFFTVTRVEAGVGESTIATINGVGGLARITTDAAENDGINLQAFDEAWELTTDQDLYFGAFGVSLDNVTQSDLLMGLCITDTDLLGGMTDGVYFRKVDGSAVMEFVLEKDSVETATASVATLVNATAVDLEFYWEGSSGIMEAFVNGVSVGEPATTNLPDNEFLRLSWHFLTGEAVAHTCDCDLLRVIMIGR